MAPFQEIVGAGNRFSRKTDWFNDEMCPKVWGDKNTVLLHIRCRITDDKHDIPTSVYFMGFFFFMDNLIKEIKPTAYIKRWPYIWQLFNLDIVETTAVHRLF